MTRTSKRAAIALYVSSVIAGVATTMLGPAMPGLQARWHIGDADAGLLFTAQFLASVLTAAAAGPLGARYGHFRLIPCGMLLLAAGLAGCALGGWPIVLFCVALYGSGLGLVIPGGNLAVASLYARDSARPVMLLNLAWCIGAVAAPAFIALLPGVFLWSFAIVAAAGGAVFVGLDSAAAKPSTGTPARSHFAVVAAALLFLYVGSETTIGGWVASLAARTAGTRGLWAVLPSIFWLAMLVGRSLAPWLLPRFPPKTLVPAGLVCASIGVAALLTASSARILAGGVLCGLGLAPVFPLVVSQYLDRKPAGGVSSLLFSAAGLGGAAIPPLVGFISQASGNLRIGMATTLLFLAGAFLLQLRLARPFGSRPLDPGPLLQ